MKQLLQISDIDRIAMARIFSLADAMDNSHALLEGKSVVLFFPPSSIRTRLAFEKGIALLGGRSVLFPSDALDKKEALRDVAGYLSQWADIVIVRHPRLSVIAELARYSEAPIVNGMSDEAHPCEILSDLYAISKLRKDFLMINYVYMGPRGNIGNTWHEASRSFGFPFRQCCPEGRGYEIPGAAVVHSLEDAMNGADCILTDSIPSDALSDFLPMQITASAMRGANPGALLNPCPPFTRGAEVSEDAIDGGWFVGYSFKKSLLPVQQALVCFLLGIKKDPPCSIHG